ncbi:MAG: T9SS type A sorting domain-containing protein [Bacteroidia bacterium]
MVLILYLQGNYQMYAWMFSGSSSVLGTEPWYVPQQSGMYIVQVTDSNGCSGLSPEYNHFLTGIEELPQLSAMVYPNPSMGVSYLKLSEVGHEAQVVILDIKGQILQQHKVEPSQTMQPYPLDLSQYAEGVYIIRVIQQDYKPWMGRLMINR